MRKQSAICHSFLSFSDKFGKRLMITILALLSFSSSFCQRTLTSNLLDQEQRKSGFDNDSTETTNVPEGIYVWTIDDRFGDITPATYDTIPHNFQNSNFTSGTTGHYNYTGNLGAPRISRLFSEQGANMQRNPFIFKQPYDFFLKNTNELLFTNTKSPFTTLTYNTCGNKTNGEDRINALFSVNSGKRLGMGFKADYLYGRGYYEGQSTADFDGTIYASYRGDQYQLHTFFQHTYLKTRENGGVENDDYVNRPESFPTKYGTADMPVNLARAWNKIGGNQFFLTHRYSLGFHRYRDAEGKIIKSEKIPTSLNFIKKDSLQTDTLQKNELIVRQNEPTPSNADSIKEGDIAQQPRIPEGMRIPQSNDNNDILNAENDSTKVFAEFVPVTSFIHTLRVDDNTRYFISNESNTAEDPGYFSDFFIPTDSANDRIHHLSVENMFAIELREGFNKWMKMGIRLFGKHEYASYDFRIPMAETLNATQKYHENYFTVGAQILSQQNRIIKYNLLGEIRTTGTDWGEFNIEADAKLSIPLKKDSLHFNFDGFVRNERASFFYRHYHARNAWWDNNDLSKMFHVRVGATLRYKQTCLIATLENIQNYLYFQESLTPYEASDGYTAYHHAVNVAQATKNVQLLALTLKQDLHLGVLHWDNELTYQTTTNSDVFPIPTFSAYSNLYLLFHIAKVLRTQIGADVRYFTSYYAPAYSPIIGQYVVQDTENRVKIGNYPYVNVYANFHLKRTRFYIMCSHVNFKSGSGKPFLVPHYPLNRLIIRFGVSWNFVN